MRGTVKVQDSTRKELLYAALEAECTAAQCMNQLARLIQNGRVRERFIGCGDAARRNSEMLVKLFRKKGSPEAGAVIRCEECLISPQSFSLTGALNVAIETLEAGIRIYKELIAATEDRDVKEYLRGIVKEKSLQRTFLRKEKRFTHYNDGIVATLDTYCIGEIISKLWR